MTSELGVDGAAVVVGHSSGAVAALRLAETQQIGALVLVGAAGGGGEGGHGGPGGGLHLGPGGRHREGKRLLHRPLAVGRDQGGLTTTSRLLTGAQANVGRIVVFGSTDDPFLPWVEQEEVATSLGADLRRSLHVLSIHLLRFEDRGHFMDQTFPELITTVRAIVEAS